MSSPAAFHFEYFTLSPAGTLFAHSVLPMSGVARTSKTKHRTSPYPSPLAISVPPNPTIRREEGSRRASTPFRRTQSPPPTLIPTPAKHTVRFVRAPASRQVAPALSDSEDEPETGGAAPAPDSDSDVPSTIPTSAGPVSPSATGGRQGTRRILRTKHRASGSEPSPIGQGDGYSSDDDGQKTAKPEGEAGRPGRGGYTLQTVLAWDHKEYETVSDYIKELVKKTLDCQVQFSKQPSIKLMKIRRDAATKFPILNKYLKDWATDDFIRGHLKYQKAVLKKEETMELAAESVLRNERKLRSSGSE